MDINALLAALPAGSEEHICLLFEAGAQSETDFLAFKCLHQSRMYSLYLHPQLVAFQNYGPWLLKVDAKEQLKGYLDTLPGCIGVIISDRFLPSLAVQLSHGCTILSPEGTAALVRFYASHVIGALAARAECDWHAYLFRGIMQWWLPGETQWQPLSIMPSENETFTNPLIRLDSTTWQQIADSR